MTTRSMRIAGERWVALTSVDPSLHAEEGALAYAFVDGPAPSGWTDLGRAPILVRPLRLGPLPLVAPFSRGPRAGFREITTDEPRTTRLWDRFSIDVGVGIERNAAYFRRRIFGRLDEGYRVFIFEDGDRYAIRAMCIFDVKREEARATGHVYELLHDRSVNGMRAASHLLGLAVREMTTAGATAAVAWSLAHSGSFPIYVRHAFVPPPSSLRGGELRFVVRAIDPALAEVVGGRDRWYLSYLDARDEG